MFSFVCGVAAMFAMGAGSLTTRDFAKYGREVLETIRVRYSMPEKHFLANEYEEGKPHNQVAFNWGVGVMLPALNAACKLDPSYKVWLRQYAETADRYWNLEGPIPGFDVLPAPKPRDRYYDDNEWMVIAMADTSEILNDPHYAKRAEQALKFVLSGEDEKLGGGIYWREEEKTSKNTCSNGPGVAACLAVFRLTKKQEYLRRAREIYRWTAKTLQDPKDNLFWDAIELNGKIGEMKWSYNTALMIRSASELYGITSEKHYAEDAEKWVKASRAKWLHGDPIALHDGGRFAHLLFESWIFEGNLVPNGSGKEAALAALPALEQVYAWKNELGLFGGEWGRPIPADHHKFDMIDQASVARAFFMAATLP